LERHAAAKRDPVAALVAAGQVLSREGDFTVAEVADRAGVGRQTFYRHFESRDELVLAVIEENLAAGTAVVANAADGAISPLERLEAMFRFMVSTRPTDNRRVLPFHTRERARLSRLYPTEVGAAYSPLRVQIIEVLRDAADAGETDSVDVERDADVLLQVMMSYARMLSAPNIGDDETQIIDHLWDFCLAGLRRASSRAEPIRP
jgi:AcrR family transcriptional regulator